MMNLNLAEKLPELQDEMIHAFQEEVDFIVDNSEKGEPMRSSQNSDNPFRMGACESMRCIRSYCLPSE